MHNNNDHDRARRGRYSTDYRPIESWNIEDISYFLGNDLDNNQLNYQDCLLLLEKGENYAISD
jgi:hypothetical protein